MEQFVWESVYIYIYLYIHIYTHVFIYLFNIYIHMYSYIYIYIHGAQKKMTQVPISMLPDVVEANVGSFQMAKRQNA